MEKNTQQTVIYFDQIKEKILKALDDRKEKFKMEDKLTLIEGFINQPFSTHLSNSIVIGGSTVPMIMLLGESGQIYFIALKALLPEIKV